MECFNNERLLKYLRDHFDPTLSVDFTIKVKAGNWSVGSIRTTVNPWDDEAYGVLSMLKGSKMILGTDAKGKDIVIPLKAFKQFLSYITTVAWGIRIIGDNDNPDGWVRAIVDRHLLPALNREDADNVPTAAVTDPIDKDANFYYQDAIIKTFGNKDKMLTWLLDGLESMYRVIVEGSTFNGFTGRDWHTLILSTADAGDIIDDCFVNPLKLRDTAASMSDHAIDVVDDSDGGGMVMVESSSGVA